MILKTSTLCLLLTLCVAGNLRAQSLAEELSTGRGESLTDDLFTETIKIISNSKKIFILTNDNQKLRKGDFVTLIVDDEMATRAVVAKVTSERVGIKILRIYSLTQWQKLRLELPVQIIRGDDSYFKKASQSLDENASPAEAAEAAVIKSEEDLYNDTGMDDTQDEESNRNIRPDNIVGMGYSQLGSTDTNGRERKFNRVTLSWAKQVVDNYWFEGVYSFINLPRFPSPEVVQSIAHEFVAKLKYNVKAPSYTFVMPYIGFLKRFVQAPAVESGDSPQERAKISDLEKIQIAVGATILRRLVPGWFLTVNLGTDMINVGVAIEF